MTLPFRRSAWAVGLVVFALVVVPSAQAGPLVASAPDCNPQVWEKPFLPWADPANYVLAPTGTLESARDWTLDGGADRSWGGLVAR